MVSINAKNNKMISKQAKVIATQMLFDDIPMPTIDLFMKSYAILCNGGATRSEIAEVGFISKQGVSKNFKYLIAKGYIEKHKRCKYELSSSSVIKDKDIRDWATLLGVQA